MGTFLGIFSFLICCFVWILYAYPIANDIMDNIFDRVLAVNDGLIYILFLPMIALKLLVLLIIFIAPVILLSIITTFINPPSKEQTSPKKVEPNYNKGRQDQIMLVYTPKKHAEINRIVKRTVDWFNENGLEKEHAMREVAVLEGWDVWEHGTGITNNYLYNKNLLKPIPDLIQEADSRDVWIEKYQAYDVDFFPMDFSDEESYAIAVKNEQDLRESYVKNGFAYEYNRERQEELERGLRSYDEVCSILKYTPTDDDSFEYVIRQVALREKWRYYNITEADITNTDLKIARESFDFKKRICSPDILKVVKRIEEVDRRDAWMERCEHGKEVRLFPMDFKNEETYRVAVEFEYERMKDREDPCRVPYNIDRQRELESLLACRRLDENDAKRISKVLGRKVHSITNDDIYEISVHEGWKYYFTDGKFHGDTRLRCMNKAYESIARKKWITRCPHGDEVDVYPLDYPNEEAYQSAVEAAYEKRKAEIK